MQRKSAKELVLQFLNTLSHYDRAVASSTMWEGGGADIHILVFCTIKMKSIAFMVCEHEYMNTSLPPQLLSLLRP